MYAYLPYSRNNKLENPQPTVELCKEKYNEYKYIGSSSSSSPTSSSAPPTSSSSTSSSPSSSSSTTSHTYIEINHEIDIIFYIVLYICILCDTVSSLKKTYYNRRKLRSQTCDNLPRWSSKGGKSQRRERVRRKKMQVR
jgi:hypothetical protein